MDFVRRFLASVVGLALLTLPGVRIATAQTVGASLQGFITDSSGAALPNAQILVVNISTGATLELTPDKAGRYRVPLLPPGEYELHVTASGLQPVERRGLQLAVGQTLVVDLTLQVGRLETAVSVTGDAPRINLTEGGVSGLIDDRQIRDLPLNGRS